MTDGGFSKVSKGFTLLEIIVSIVCLGIILTIMISRFGKIADESTTIIALEEMRHIKEAVRDGFYPDLGLIPGDPGKDGEFASSGCPNCGNDDRPWLSTRYLCLTNDGEGNPEYEEMYGFLKKNRDEDAARALMEWDRYLHRGWRGPYMEQDIREIIDSSVSYPFPLVSSPWSEKCEEMAREVEESGNYDEARELRKGRYYFIIVDRDEDMDPVKETARIISFGQDCCDSGAYYTDFGQENPSIPATAEDLRKIQGSDSGSSYEYDSGDDIVVFIFGGGPIRKPGS
jgi:prepilin-type N-terminal cleavage/methylation domain-containing protein